MKQTNFIPYEGFEPYLFVSYSHKDREVVYDVLERLNREGFRIWYDDGIEWGTEWPASISKHLQNCAVCIAFHSKNSVISQNCRQEINFALEKGKGMLSIFLENVTLPEGIDMQLSTYQKTFLYQYDNPEIFYERLIKTEIIQLCRQVTYSTSKGFDHQSIIRNSHVSNINIDKEISEHLDILFENKCESDGKSVLQKKLNTIKSKNYMNSVAAVMEQQEEQNTIFYDNVAIFKKNDFGVSPAEKVFSYPVVKEEKTIIFLINWNVDYSTLSKYLDCEQLQFDESESNGRKTLDFSFRQYDKTGNLIVILTFDKALSNVFINMGFIMDDRVFISKQPTSMAVSNLKPKGGQPLSKCLYEDNEVYADVMEQSANQTIIFEAKISDNVPVTVDPETATIVKREIYFDEATKKWKARMRLAANKSYFSFSLRPHGERKSRVPLSELEIAHYYCEGMHGFPRNFEQALTYYEQAGTADAEYEIAVMFRNYEEIKDEDIYLEYLNRAVEKGSAKAAVELSLLLFESDSEADREKACQILEDNMDEEDGIVSFTMGYQTEAQKTGRLVSDAFEYYYQAYQKSYYPVYPILGLNKKTEISKETLRQHYLASADKGLAKANYCMGCMEFCGIKVSANKAKGLEFLTESAKSGYILAMEALVHIYEGDGTYGNKELAMAWSEKLMETEE